MYERGNLGRWGEAEAAKFLEAKGYQILVKNYRCRLGEIDLICSWQGRLVFVEVKTRKSTTYGYPAEAVTKAKQEKIRLVALSYLQETKARYSSLAFDVVEIYWQMGHLVINHLPKCF